MVVGGGPVARRRTESLLQADALITVIAPQVEQRLECLSVQIERRPYREGDLEGAILDVVATDDPAVNEKVADDAATAGILINRADEPCSGQIIMPAYVHRGPVTLSVHTGGISAAAAATILGQLSDALDPDWPRLLEIVAPYRRLIQQRVHEPRQRQDCLKQLTGPDAVETLKQQGTEALKRFCEDLATVSAIQ